MNKFSNIAVAAIGLFVMAILVFLFFYTAILVLPIVLAVILIGMLINFFNAKDTITIQKTTTYKKVSKKSDDVIDAEYKVLDDN